jgi:hypothetical protein
MTKYIDLQVRLTQKELHETLWCLKDGDVRHMEAANELFEAADRERFKANVRAFNKLFKVYQEAIG